MFSTKTSSTSPTHPILHKRREIQGIQRMRLQNLSKTANRFLRSRKLEGNIKKLKRNAKKRTLITRG